MCEQQVLMKLVDLHQHFPLRRSIRDIVTRQPVKTVKAVDGVDLEIFRGETLGVVGESGCGKSTLARTVLRLYEPTKGQIFYNNQNFGDLKKTELELKRTELQMIFQDPYSCLNPRMSVLEIIKEPLRYHKIVSENEVEDKARHLLKLVGIPEYAFRRFPGEFSGGQRQRIGIARSLTVNPKLIFADEPVSSLDVSIQAQIINLINDLKEELELTLVFISHDLSVVRFLTDRVAVMYLGRLVEISSTEDIFDQPLHPYTSILINSSPILDPRKRGTKQMIQGETPSPIDLPTGCRFHPRCPRVQSLCLEVEPNLARLNGRLVACHYPLTDEVRNDR